MSTLAQSEREALSDLLDAVGPDAPTLCEGWSTADLAAHLVVREGDPLAGPGMFVRPLAGITERRMRRQLRDGNWTARVDRVRRGPQRATVAAIPGVDKAMNGMKFFIHHEDVRRAGDRPAAPRPLKVSHEEELWRRAIMLARMVMRRSPVGIVLENALDPEERIRVRAGKDTVTLMGKPSEMVLWLSGRRAVAEVELVGTDEAVAALRAHTTSL